MGCMVGSSPKIILGGNALFVEFKGVLHSTCEVDFVLDTGEQIIPVEVKAEVNFRAESLKSFVEKYMPEKAVRVSMSDYREEDWLVNLSLYAIEEGILGRDCYEHQIPKINRK